jgi:hypothetical protein
MQTVGRNDRCTCGSGRKYKRCCAPKDNPSVSTALPWKQVRAARDSVNSKLVELSAEFYDKAKLERAWDDWCSDYEEPLVMHGGEFVTFMSWFLVNWLDQDKNKKIPLPPISWRLRKASEETLSPIETEYLNSVIDEPFSFFEILDPRPGEGYDVMDILTGRELFIHERLGSQSVTTGGFLFGRLGTVGEVSIFDAISDICFPFEWKTTVLELRQDIRKICKIKKDQLPSLEQITACAAMIRALYRDFRSAAENPSAPRYTNTDGESLSFNKVFFDIDDAELVFDAIHHLCFNTTKQELREDATLDDSGKFLKIEFPWLKKGNKLHPEWDNTVMGQITIERARLTVDTNSLERVEAIRRLVANHCGKLAKYKSTLIEPLEAKIAEMQKSGRRPEPSRLNEQEELNRHPEVQAQMRKLHQNHMERWVKEKIPALGGKTPIQAMKSPEGKEMVETLLTQFERKAGATTDKEFELGVLKDVRRRLGLP